MRSMNERSRNANEKSSAHSATLDRVAQLRCAARISGAVPVVEPNVEAEGDPNELENSGALESDLGKHSETMLLPHLRHRKHSDATTKNI